jgi:hypothetical protein
MQSVILSFIIAFIVHSGVILKAQSYSGSTWTSTRSNGSGVIKFAYVETPRFVYKDGQGKLTGISVDVMHDFVDWLQRTKSIIITVNYVGDGSSFKTMYESVKSSQGGVFGLGNITITDERKREVKFSPPFITNFAILVSHDHFPVLSQLEQMATLFKGAHAYTAKGTINEGRMLLLKKNFFSTMDIQYTTSSQETMEKIVSDPQGFGYLDLAFYLEAVQLKKNVRRHPVGDKAAEQFGFVMPMKSDWAPLLEEFFAAEGGYLASSRYRSILQKHLGEAGMKLLKTSSLTNR